MKKTIEMIGKSGKGKVNAIPEENTWYKDRIPTKQRPGKTLEENIRMNVRNLCQTLRRKGFKVSQKKLAEGGYRVLIENLG
jgi:hypothetical protein